jgi:hypothetical protein
MQISGIQTDVILGDRAANLERMRTAIIQEVEQSSRLIRFAGRSDDGC